MGFYFIFGASEEKKREQDEVKKTIDFPFHLQRKNKHNNLNLSG